MGDVVNLSRYRKTKQRQDEQRQAAINREKFGKTKAETERDRLRRQQQEKALDGKRLDDSSDKK